MAVVQQSSKNVGLTIDEVLDHVGFGMFQWRMLILTGLCWMADAAEMTVLSFLIIEAEKYFEVSSTLGSLLGSAVFVGMWLGLSGFGILADKYGRRTSYLISLIVILVFGLVSAFSPFYAFLVVSRLIVGIGVGGAGVAITLFSEFLPEQQRGTFSIYIEGFWTLGSLVGAGIAWATLPVLDWRWMVGIAALPPLIPLFCYPWLPESPRQLLVMGKPDEALQLLKNAAKENNKTLPEGLKLYLSPEPIERGQLRDMFAPNLWRTTLVLFLLSFVNCFAYYGLVIITPDFFSTIPESSDAILATVTPTATATPTAVAIPTEAFLEVFIISAAEFPGIFIAAFMINRIGRKKTQAILLTITAIFALLLLSPVPRWTLTLFAMITRMSILGAYATLLVVYIEAFPTKIRATGVGVCGSVARIAGILTPFVAGIQINGSFIVPLTVYAGFALAAGIFAMLLPKETTGLALSDIDVVKSTNAPYDSDDSEFLDDKPLLSSSGLPEYGGKN